MSNYGLLSLQPHFLLHVFWTFVLIALLANLLKLYIGFCDYLREMHVHLQVLYGHLSIYGLANLFHYVVFFLISLFVLHELATFAFFVGYACYALI